jgi:hypothetical protein
LNDTELDRLLDTWDAPAPPRGLRERVRAAFPNAERRGFSGRFWLTMGAAAALCATLAVGMERVADAPGDGLLMPVYDVFSHIVESVHAYHTKTIVERIRVSQPTVYVDGKPTGALEFGHAATMRVSIPGAGVYRVEMFGAMAGWTEAGTMLGNNIEFVVDGRHVRIECSQPIGSRERAIFVRRLSE